MDWVIQEAHSSLDSCQQWGEAGALSCNTAWWSERCSSLHIPPSTFCTLGKHFTLIFSVIMLKKSIYCLIHLGFRVSNSKCYKLFILYSKCEVKLCSDILCGLNAGGSHFEKWHLHFVKCTMLGIIGQLSTFSWSSVNCILSWEVCKVFEPCLLLFLLLLHFCCL